MLIAKEVSIVSSYGSRQASLINHSYEDADNEEDSIEEIMGVLINNRIISSIGLCTPSQLNSDEFEEGRKQKNSCRDASKSTSSAIMGDEEESTLNQVSPLPTSG